MYSKLTNGDFGKYFFTGVIFYDVETEERTSDYPGSRVTTLTDVEDLDIVQFDFNNTELPYCSVGTRRKVMDWIEMNLEDLTC